MQGILGYSSLICYLLQEQRVTLQDTTGKVMDKDRSVQMGKEVKDWKNVKSVKQKLDTVASSATCLRSWTGEVSQVRSESY